MKRHSRKKRSWVWEYFLEDTSVPNSLARTVICKVENCEEKIESYDSSTNPLIFHLHSKHGLNSPVKKRKIVNDNISKDHQNLADSKLYVFVIKLIFFGLKL